MILIDSTPLVALCDPRDSLHARARLDLRKLGLTEFAVCDAVLTEAISILPLTRSRAHLYRFLNDFGVSPISPTQPRIFWSNVFAWLFKYADHRPDFADAYQAVFSGRDHSIRIWTYDREFQTIWRRPDGSAIPLAIGD